MSPTQGKTILHLVFLLGDTRSGPWLQKKDPNKCPNLLPLRRGLALISRPYREGTPAPCSTEGDPPLLCPREGGAHRSRRVVRPRSSPAALPAEAGWGAVKRSRRWKTRLHPHCPGFRSRQEPPAPDLTYAGPELWVPVRAGSRLPPSR